MGGSSLAEALSRGLSGLLADVSGAEVRARGDGRWTIGGAEPVEVRVDNGGVELVFAGWSERIDGDDEDAAEVVASALDFVAAALFGELRVVEERAGEVALRRSLEVRVEGRWRLHGRRGGLGWRGLGARLRGALERRERANEGGARPRTLRDAGPSGLASAPWSGAAGESTGGAAPLAIDGELDLHNFSAKEVGRLVREYITVCRERRIFELRIVHGKGKGVLRRTVHSLLEKHPAVASFRIGGHREGSWGATMVTLHPPDGEGPDGASR